MSDAEKVAYLLKTIKKLDELSCIPKSMEKIWSVLDAANKRLKFRDQGQKDDVPG